MLLSRYRLCRCQDRDVLQPLKDQVSNHTYSELQQWTSITLQPQNVLTNNVPANTNLTPIVMFFLWCNPDTKSTPVSKRVEMLNSKKSSLLKGGIFIVKVPWGISSVNKLLCLLDFGSFLRAYKNTLNASPC